MSIEQADVVDIFVEVARKGGFIPFPIMVLFVTAFAEKLGVDTLELAHTIRDRDKELYCCGHCAEEGCHKTPNITGVDEADHPFHQVSAWTLRDADCNPSYRMQHRTCSGCGKCTCNHTGRGDC